MFIPSRDNDHYYPPPESKGGWRRTGTRDDIHHLGGMDAEKLDLVHRNQGFLYGGDSWSIVVIRHGYLVREYHTFNVLVPTRFDIWSGTKSFTGTAWGLLLDDSRQGQLPDDQQVDLDSRIYDFIEDGHPLSDEGKERITPRHLLSMTSGIAGEKQGLAGNPTTSDNGAFEHVLGRCANRYGGRTDKLVAEPGTDWNYSDPAFAHLALSFAQIMKREMSDYLSERIFQPIGIENLSWDVQGGSGFIGPHTNAHTGVHISARELARFGYLMLHHGEWDGHRLVPAWWLDIATKTSQDLNPNYGYTWWVNTQGSKWQGLPKDTFALMGYRCNLCYIIPSLDLIVARIGSGPATWDEQTLIQGVVDAVIKE